MEAWKEMASRQHVFRPQNAQQIVPREPGFVSVNRHDDVLIVVVPGKAESLTVMPGNCPIERRYASWFL